MAGTGERGGGWATVRFQELVTGPADALAGALDEAALLVAAHAEPGLDIPAYQARLDELAAACATPTLDQILHRLFAVEGFRGNENDYYDPRNSYLHQVLDRRLGIPITLGIVMMEVARRLGLPMAGVPMPGHFLVRMEGDPPVLVDAFAGGRVLSPAQCEERFRSTQGPAAPFDPAYLEPMGPHGVLARLLANLRHIQAHRQDSHALEWVLRLRTMLPGVTVEERSERAGVLVALAQFDQAADVLESLADEAPPSRAMDLLARAKRLRARLN
ncbi:MAG: transglutaminase-like domain-containing protein [Actinobacteria bacterium]|nr:transglutaminase-like domain-containing protein [Actinomycetota bacterium]MBW3649822.1 transglutaminase-like domain-containing protein [Actinomycetota bacterium]